MTKAEIEQVLKKHQRWLVNPLDPRGTFANLCGADLHGAKLSGANLQDADLAGANLRGAKLACADLCGADLRGADLACADLYGADLARANLRDTDLHGEDLSAADLQDADLSGANLSGADLSDANLRGADLSDANLRGANLHYTDLHGANLNGANLDKANIDYSCWPLWCGSLRVKIDARIAAQLMYHAMRAMQSVKEDADVAAVLACEANIRLANRFHHVQLCGEIVTPKEMKGGAK